MLKFPLRATNALAKPVFQFAKIADALPQIEKTCSLRNVKVDLDGFKQSFERHSRLRSEFLDLRKETGKLGKDRSPESIAKLKEYKPRLKLLQAEISELEDTMQLLAESLPNSISPEVTEEEQVVHWINKDFKLPSSESRDHKAIMERLGLVDFVNASRVSGNSWYYLLGDAVRLEQALITYSIDLAKKWGFKLCSPPSIVKTEITTACGFKPRDQNGETQVYELPDDMCLTGTAEIPLAGLYSNQQIEVPKRLCGISRSYRAEAGARGRDTRGLYRVHEFSKVELFSWCENSIEQSESEFERIVSFQKQFVESLGLHAKVLNMPHDDLGAPAYRKYDIETWMPGRNAYGEISSTSICLDYQSVRLSTSYRDGQKVKYVHTLNGTACAVPRVIVAIIENFWDEASDSIVVPEVLRPYMGIDVIEKQ